MPLVFACIAPHGSIAIPEAKPKDRPSLASATTAGMQELGRRFTAADPDVSIVLTPHNIHVEGAMAVIDAGAISGDLVQWFEACWDGEQEKTHFDAAVHTRSAYDTAFGFIRDRVQAGKPPRESEVIKVILDHFEKH